MPLCEQQYIITYKELAMGDYGASGYWEETFEIRHGEKNALAFIQYLKSRPKRYKGIEVYKAERVVLKESDA